MKRVLLWILGIVIVLGVAGAILLGRIDTQFVGNQIADATAKATGKPLVFASAPSLSLLPPGVKFGQAGWGEIKDGQGLAVSVKSGMVELELAPLLSGNLVVREVRLDNPVLEVRAGNAQARGFYTRLGFQEAAVRSAYYEDPPDDAVIMALPLG